MARDSAFSAAFDETVFTEAIIETMRMGMPEDPAQRLVFHWDAQTNESPASPSGSPYGWEIDENEPDPISEARSLSVTYALEMSETSSVNTLAGTFETPKATVTLLDSEYQQVKDADYCTIGTSRYSILYHAPTVGLFGVDVHTLHIQAQDEA